MGVECRAPAANVRHQVVVAVAVHSTSASLIGAPYQSCLGTTFWAKTPLVLKPRATAAAGLGRGRGVRIHISLFVVAYIAAKCTFVKSSTDQPILILARGAHKAAFLAVHRFLAVEGPNGYEEEGETIRNLDMVDGGRGAVGTRAYGRTDDALDRRRHGCNNTKNH